MKILHGYLFRQNIFYLFLMLAVGIGIYLLADLFEKIDDLLEAQLAWQTICVFFAYKIPLIVSQILPAVALLAVLIQLGLMRQNLEILALQASAISFFRLFVFFFFYACVLSGVQLAFSEFLGVWGSEKSEAIWREQVRKKDMQGTIIEDVWFREGRAYVHIDRLYPRENRGEGIEINFLDTGGIQKIVRAREFTARAGKWLLKEAVTYSPGSFTVTGQEKITYRFSTDLKSFQTIDFKKDLDMLPLPELLSARARLEAAGSNVEWLETALHGRVAYAFSILSLILGGLALTQKIHNIYVLVLCGVVCLFIYYGVFVFSTSAGAHGVIPPWLGAWLVNILFMGVAGLQLVQK